MTRKEQMVAELDEYFEEILTDKDLEFLQVFEDEEFEPYGNENEIPDVE